MDDLIEALQIMRKYKENTNEYSPSNSDHDAFYIDIENEDVSDEDVKRLDELGFFKSEEWGGFMSFRFGSC